MNKWIYVIVFLVSISIVDAKLFNLDVVTPSSAGCSIFGCTMQGDIDMNGFTIYNVTVVNASVQEFDPIFTSENGTIWLAINAKLNISDQRYNDSFLINGVNATLQQEILDRIANDSYLQGQINYLDLYKLNESDQRYNDTGLINSVNQSLIQELNTKLNISDQRYNDTGLIDALNQSFTNILTNYYNKSESDGKYYPLNGNPAGYINSTDNIWLYVTNTTGTAVVTNTTLNPNGTFTDNTYLAYTLNTYENAPAGFNITAKINTSIALVYLDNLTYVNSGGLPFNLTIWDSNGNLLLSTTTITGQDNVTGEKYFNLSTTPLPIYEGQYYYVMVYSDNYQRAYQNPGTYPINSTDIIYNSGVFQYTLGYDTQASNLLNIVTHPVILGSTSNVTTIPPTLFFNESKLNQTLQNNYYPLNNNPAGYLTNASLGNLTNNTWVLKSGDSMYGPLNMSNNSIYGVDVLEVHNITGRSPVFINSPLISGSTINATNIYGSFFGDINGQNGTIFGLQVTNGKISNLTVVDNMFVDTNATFNGSLIPAINDTYYLGIPDKYWKSFYVTNLYAGNISTPDIDNLYNITSQILLDLDNKLNITDQRYNDTYLIGIVNDTVYILYNDTLGRINTLNLTIMNVSAELNNEILARIYADSLLQSQIDNKLNITDQRYNDTYLADENWIYRTKGSITSSTIINVSSILSDAKIYLSFENNLLDNLGNYNASDIGSPAITYSPGVVNQSANMTVYTDSISLDDAQLQPKSWTFMFWINFPNTPNGYNQVMYRENAATASWGTRWIYYDGAGLHYVTEGNFVNSDNMVCLGTVNTNQWYHVVGTYNNDTKVMRCYIDGIETNNVTKSGDPYYGGNFNTTFGRPYSPIYGWWQAGGEDFYLDEYLFFDKELNTSQIDYFYNNGTGRYSGDIITTNTTIINTTTEFYTFYFNETKLNLTLGQYALNSSLAQEILDRIANDSYLQGQILYVYNETLNKLNITDQRYNDTLFIQVVNETLLGLLGNETQARINNDSYLQGQINYLDQYKLNTSDQRYNDTVLIYAVNSSVWNELASKLNISDQRYNDTSLIYAVNSSVWAELALKLNITDQRYNDTAFIIANYYNKSESDARYYLITNPAGYINWSTFGSVQLEPTGFDNPTGTTAGTGATLSYNSTSQVFSISGTYSFWQKGINYTRSGTDTVTVPVGPTGVYYIYYNNGTLTASNTITGRQFISDYVAVAEIYYNNNTGQVVWQGSETHGHIMDSATHTFIHNFISTRYVSGIAPQNMTVDQNGNLAAHAQLGVSAGAIQDEDLQHTIAAYPFPANIQVFYQLGTSPNWSVKTPDAYPMIYSGDSTGYVGVGGRPPYNRLSGGVWSLTEVASNDYFLLHLFANNDIRGNRSLFIVQGQNEYTSLANARAGATTEINSIITTGLPMAEAKPIATFIVKTVTGMANVPKASFQSIDGTAQFVDWRFSLQTGSSGNIGGTVTLVNTGTGLTGGPITSSGTISLDTAYVQGLINTALANFTYNETDPRFTAENSTIWAAINSKLNETDQRYNDTALISLVNQTIWNELNNKLNITDQRYNDTGLINSVNQSIWNELALKLNISDQRYNDTAYILNQLLNYYNKTEIDFLFANYTFNETDPIFVAENITIWSAINSKLNITDQRYNDTAFILNELLNYYNKTEVDFLFANYTFNETDPIFTAENISIWMAINTKLNESDQRYNDTAFILNQLLNYYNKTEIDTLLTNYYNKTEVDGFLDLKLNITDQRYNDTQLIYEVNTSTWVALNTKLNITDQRYNDTLYIDNKLLNYYNKTEVDALFNNFTINETDPIFTAENITIWNAINIKLNDSDQRYNDTALIYAVNSSIYIELGNLYANDTYLYGLIQGLNTSLQSQIDTKLNITDQRYNDTQLINDMNTSIWQELAIKLNITDQRYNDTSFILNQLLNYYNKTEIDAMFANFTINETDPIFTAENSSIWAAINQKLNESDQRYNDTAYILNQLLNYYNKTETDNLLAAKLNITDQRYNETYLILSVNTSLQDEIQARIGNDSFLQGQIDLKLNITDQRYNDTLLIYAVNSTLQQEILDRIANDSYLLGLIQNNTYDNDSMYLLITDQRYNDTQLIEAVNTTSNIQGLGFNTTTQLDTRYYPLNSNPNNYINDTSMFYNTTFIDSTFVNNTFLENNFYNNSFIDNNFYNNSFMNNNFYNNSFINSNFYNNTFMDNNFYNNSFIDSNYYNKTEIDAMFANFTINETDPIFVAENVSIWAAINQKLNITDQRYNDTALIDALNLSLQSQIDTKLNITDQRYNDTQLIYDVNTSVWNELALKLNISDQRYNDTQYIINALLNYYNKTESDNRYIQNETDPIFLLENTSIWAAINLKLNISDQRYNDTQFVLNQLLNYYNKTETDNLLDNKLNISDQRYNDTQLINDVNTTGNIQGLGFNTTTQLDTIYYPLNSNPHNYVNDTSQFYNATFIDSTFVNNTFLENNFYNNTFIDNNFHNNSFIDNNFYNNSFMNNNFYNNSFINSNFYNNTFMDNNFYNNSFIDANYYNKTEIDAMFANFTINETDPIFTAENITIWNAINTKLNITDQRYNDTALIDALNISLQGQIDNKLNTTDQRYNDTVLITDINTSIWQELALKLNISDQRYNDTQYIINQLINYYNKTEIDSMFANFTWNETDPVFVAENASIWQAINSKLNITDQRYNDTQLILDVNTSVWNELALKLNISDQRYNDTAFILNQLLNYYNKTEIDIMLLSYIQNETDPIFTAENTSIWNAINTKLNISDQRYNDTAYIVNLLLDYYNKTETNNLLDTKLNITDQRYNDTALINGVNQSVWNELALKLNITDQRYNDTQYIINALLNYYNKTESDARYIQNETDPIFLLENTTIWNAINQKLNISDQRYNDTQYILNQLLNYYNKTEVDALIAGINATITNNYNTTITNYYNMTYIDQNFYNTSYINNNFYNISYIDNNFYNQTEINNMFANFTINETDPIFTAENITLWAAINQKLNITDQRYNDTQFILNELLNYYNKTETDNLLAGKLNITDQRYNDTQLINDVNTSLWIELALKLNISDQRYNDTAYIINQLLNYYNKTEIDAMFANFTINETDPIFQVENASIWAAINSKLNETDQRYNDTALIIAVNTSVWNELGNKLNITDQRYNDTALIYAVNISVWNELNNKLNITDQRYNDTGLIYLVNTSVWNELSLKLNISDQRYNDTALIYSVNTSLWSALDNKLNITDQRYNDTLLIQMVNATIKQPTGPYLAYDNTTFWINETYLNNTINNISKVRKIIYNMTCTAVAGTCNVISAINISYQITEIKVTPTTLTNNYKSQVTEYPNTVLIIDKDRAIHTGVWDIASSYAINGQVQGTITNANINELFTFSIIYLTNGVQ